MGFLFSFLLMHLSQQALLKQWLHSAKRDFDVVATLACQEGRRESDILREKKFGIDQHQGYPANAKKMYNF